MARHSRAEPGGCDPPAPLAGASRDPLGHCGWDPTTRTPSPASLAESGRLAVGLCKHDEERPNSAARRGDLPHPIRPHGRALVVGPVDTVESGALLMPVMITDLFATAMDVRVPDRVAEWLARSGPIPSR